MQNRIITISREFGSGGRTIGKEVAKKLSISCYDEELIEKIAEKTGLVKDYIQENGEYAASGNWLGRVFSGRDVNGHSTQDDLYIMQSNIIKEIAQKESCVIVGRCADYILRDRADLLKVFIHSAMDKRAERIVKLYGERADSPEKRLRDKGQEAGCILPDIYGHEVGRCPKLSYLSGQRRAGDRKMRRHNCGPILRRRPWSHFIIC